MPSRWYFSRDGKQRLGPFTFDQLRQLAAGGLLEPSHMVLVPARRKWTAASSIPGLFPPTPQPSAPEPAPGDAEELAAHAIEESDQAPERQARMFTLGLALAIVSGGVLLLVAIAVLASLDGAALTMIGGMGFLALVLGAIVGGIVWAVRAITGTITACPECKRWHARVLMKRRLIEKKKCYGLVTRRAYSHSSGSVSGIRHHRGQSDYQNFSGSTSSSGSTSWQERVPVIRTTSRLTYECRFCEAKWSETEVKQVEDFDIAR